MRRLQHLGDRAVHHQLATEMAIDSMLKSWSSSAIHCAASSFEAAACSASRKRVIDATVRSPVRAAW
jgi:hypothetical protein